MPNSLMPLNIQSQARLNHGALVQLYTPNMSIGARLRELRKQNELSQEKFGELCDVSKGMVSQWESNQTTPPSDRLIELRKHLSFSVDWVLTGEIADYMSRMKPPVRELLKVAEKLPDDMVAELTREGSVYSELLSRPKKDGNGTQ